MTEQITIKLNKSMFRPVIDNIQKSLGHGVAESDSDLVAKTLFFFYHTLFYRREDLKNKSLFETLSEGQGNEIAEKILKILNEYHQFKKSGLKF